MVTELAFIGLLSCVAAPVDDKIALKLERFPTKFTGLAFRLWLRRRSAAGGHGGQWRGAHKRRFRAWLERIQQAMHRVVAIGRHWRRGGVVPRQFSEPSGEIHRWRLNGHGV